MSESVFISHASRDREIVESRIIPVLREVGVGIWYSENDLVSPDLFQHRIREALEACHWFLVVLSPHSVDSRWVQAEVSLAMEWLPSRIVPVIVETCEPVKCHLQLKLYQYIDLRELSGEGLRRLRRTFGVGISATQTVTLPAGPASTETIIDRLQQIRLSQEGAQIAFLFQSLASPDEHVRDCAKQTLQTIGWHAAAAAAEELAFAGQHAEINNVLNGLVALESHPEVVKMLDRLSNQLTGELRNRTILLLERKALSLQSDRISQILKENNSSLTIIKALGQGLTSATFLAKHRYSESEVVIRALRRNTLSNPIFATRSSNL